MQTVLIGLISILILGIGSQWLSWRFRLPSILLLILSGFLAGPVFGFLRPEELFGELLFPLVSISVAIILFEGGLSLKLAELKKIGGVVRNLVSIGLIVTWLSLAVAAWLIFKLNFSLALVLGAILTVTGPTVIVPLLRSLHLPKKTASILKWEAMMNDPIGAILAVLVFEAIISGGLHHVPSQAVLGLLYTLFIGIVLGAVFAWGMVFLLKRYLIPDFLQSVVTLMMVTLVFSLSNHFQTESGLVAVTVMGIFLANQKKVNIKHIIEFKENLSILLISVLFVTLAARLKLEYFIQIGFSGLIFLFFAVFIARPLAVMISTWKSDLSIKERVFLGWMAPRGIVAAAVASIFALELERAGYPGAEKLLAITFFIIVSTVLLYGITSGFVASFLKIARPHPQGVLILGAHDWAQKIGLALKDNGFQVQMVDSNWNNVHSAFLAGLPSVCGDVLLEHVVDELELDDIGKFLALTQNNEVNSLAAIRFSEVFERSEVYQLPVITKKGEGHSPSSRLHARFLFKKDIEYRYFNHVFHKNGEIKKVFLTKDFTFKDFWEKHGEKATPLFLITNSGKLKIITVGETLTSKEGQTILALFEASS